MKSFPFSNNGFKVFAVVFSAFLGILVRYPYLSYDFPFGDGGLFIEMIYAIKNNHYLLPSFVNFNNTQIPFAYPPVGFYLALFSSKAFGISILHAALFLPVILNLLTIIVFVLLASELAADRVELILCAGIFPMVLQTYLWTIKGGGLSRSPGFLFTTLTLYLLLLYLKYDRKLYLVLSAAAFGLAVASHLEWGLISMASLFVFIVFFGKYKTRRDAYDLLIFGVSSVFITFPWWGTVIYRFGATPFLTAWNVAEMDTAQFFEKFFTGAMYEITIFPARDYFLPVFGLFGFGMAFFSKKRLLLPIWLLVTYIVAPKNSPISGLLPLVILIAIGLKSLDKGIYYLFETMNINIRGRFRPAISIFYLLLVMFLSIPTLFNRPIVRALSPFERASMEYVKKNTPNDAKFIVLTPYDWHSADAAEWFPYLTQRQSLVTPQGLEWVSATEFNRITGQVATLSQMVRNEQTGVETGLLAGFVESSFADYDYVVIFVNNIDEDFGGFLATEDFEIFYRKKDILILKLISSSH